MVLSLIAARFIHTLLRPASGKPLTICRCTRKTIRLIKYSADDVLVGLPAIPRRPATVLILREVLWLTEVPAERITISTAAFAAAAAAGRIVERWGIA